MANDFNDLSAKVLAAAKSAGADAADVLLVDGTTVSIEVRAGALEHAERSEGVDIGLRVFKGKKQASVSVSDLSDHTIEQMALRAVAMADVAPDDPYCGLADPDQLVRSWDVEALELYDPSDPMSADELQEAALAAEAAALAVNGVSQAQGASAGYSSSRVHMAATNGFSGGYRRTSTSTSCVAISGTGLNMERDWCGESRSHADELPSPESIGQLAGERAVARGGATRPPTGAYPVLFDERISSTLIGHMAAAINGSSIVRGSSWLSDALGKQVLPRGMTLIEDPTRKRVAGSRPFDGEGLPVAPREIILDGVLQGWTLDLSTARQLGMQSTGNAARGIGGPPSPTTGNLALTMGEYSHAELVAQMGTGLIVTSMIGSTISPTTGDYSRGAAGLWVENGEIIGPVNECTIAGNLRDMLKTLVAGNDARMHLSRNIPSLLVEGLTIAGA
ncbi:modulator protein [Amylibacter ulvae]|uniref:Modulator protein n=1 Tax=Paramylibacter ulvae TaxID=1651968 RepID=A0ABQ3D1Q3_9RHOB|nr:metallopeptidase TldD-related protein [Amylibacter ulvae]GHA47114.1 modulator protein [Amylibacter ulvae]